MLIAYTYAASNTRERLSREIGFADDGAVLVGLGDALGEKLDLTLTGAEAELRGETTTALRQALGDDAFEISASRGHTMSTEDGVAFAVASLD